MRNPQKLVDQLGLASHPVVSRLYQVDARGRRHVAGTTSAVWRVLGAILYSNDPESKFDKMERAGRFDRKEKNKQEQRLSLIHI
eukprot:1239236-Alexandrium_andersonii.AAC.1